MVTPYLVFHGECAEALAFYSGVFGAAVEGQMPYGDYVPEGCQVPQVIVKNWVMHAEMEICGTRFWFADEVDAVRQGDAVRLTLTVPTKAEAQRCFDALAAGGNVVLPPVETFYSVFHAAVFDRFGVGWSVVAGPAPV